jgi:hypothetical protein
VPSEELVIAYQLRLAAAVCSVHVLNRSTVPMETLKEVSDALIV